MQVLLLRPHQDNMALASSLREMGIETHIEPMIDIKYLTNKNSDFSDITTAIFTSQNALKAIDCNNITHLNCYVVGRKTAQLAKQLGFDKIFTADNSANSLLELILKTCNKDQERLVYFSSSTPTLDLVSILGQCQYKIRSHIAYEVIDTTELSSTLQKKIIANKIDIVLLYSYHTAEVFLQLMGKYNLLGYLSQINALVISNKVKQLIEKYQWKTIKEFHNNPIKILREL